MNISSYNHDNFIGKLPEIAKTAGPAYSALPTGENHRWRQEREQKQGKQGGLKARLKLTPHRLSLPILFLANVKSLPNKMDDLRLRITTHKWIMDCNIMIFAEPGSTAMYLTANGLMSPTKDNLTTSHYSYCFLLTKCSTYECLCCEGAHSLEHCSDFKKKRQGEVKPFKIRTMLWLFVQRAHKQRLQGPSVM